MELEIITKRKEKKRNGNNEGVDERLTEQIHECKEEKTMGGQEIFTEITEEIFPSLKKYLSLQKQRAQ